MPARHDGLFVDIASFQALTRAALRAVRGKRSKPGASAFMANLEKEILRLERELLDGRYKPGRYVTIEVRDPKPRRVSAAPFRDRVVHHALCAVIEPIFERRIALRDDRDNALYLCLTQEDGHLVWSSPVYVFR